jgi:hypothetical protein
VEVVNNFLPVSFRRPAAAEAPLRGGRIVHGSNAFGKGLRKNLFRLTAMRRCGIVVGLTTEGITAMRVMCAIALFSSLFASGCGNAGEPWVELQGQRFVVEVADDNEMNLAYWMKNTKIPLDILYFDSNRRLVSQRRDVPPCSLGNGCPPYPSSAPARYVLELNAGQAAKLGLNDGAELKFGPGIPPTP